MKKSIKTILIILILSVFSAHAQQPGYYRMQIGDFQVIALSDGTIPQELPKLLTNTQPNEINNLLSANYLPTTVETSVNAYLVKADNKLILIDAGTSDNYGPSLGRLTKSLLNVGYTPDQIDAVLITHAHIDHTGGLMQGTKMTFPNATIYLSKPEVDFWFNEENKRNATEKLKPYYQYAEASVGAYLKAGKVKTFEYGQELFPGIMPIASAGHTPGHTFYELNSRGQKLVFWGDIIHAAAIQLADPAVTIEYDVDPAAAAKTRKKAFADAAKNGYWIASDHISFPGIGHVKADGSKYVWIPANYSSAEVSK
ncbi:glyoxylase-like metal-dependent hydrolase (beta-lactamase superfamily II) [Mucilaginibacter frigoritolerans]|uniref:Glyoxylase-like metal-dependent hydrolase (Beta-lactamase superfamily II) n=1 Tax=Mucilaginibacter frigoritolerans TaxID=652788 RepID=A0A562TYG9_9SPHI|nr:MBL fold metallo-hydrolase [Mucilaginibacter frigoritolerans]TWI98651.1 glyoxylase-like metal-dependent hydrolase (beta-lactamase superfamily II) [Mucilaginibacter frigoritolerans]